MTDVEIFEREIPACVIEFSRRHDSGGFGRYRGGDGCRRQLLFLEDLQCSLLTERCVYAPRGLRFGKDGEKGRNVLIRNGIEDILPSKCQFEVHRGDKLLIETPGGGGYGHPLRIDEF